MQDFRKLRVWQAARQLTIAIYRATAKFPSSERFGLAMQMRTAAVSIVSNIAEASGRGSRKDSKRILHFAYGSACELMCQCVCAGDLGYISSEELSPLDAAVEEVRRMLAGLMARLK